MNNYRYFSPEKNSSVDDSLESNISRVFPEHAVSEVPGSDVKSAGNSASRKQSPYLQNHLPFMTYPSVGCLYESGLSRLLSQDVVSQSQNCKLGHQSTSEDLSSGIVHPIFECELLPSLIRQRSLPAFEISSIVDAFPNRVSLQERSVSINLINEFSSNRDEGICTENGLPSTETEKNEVQNGNLMGKLHIRNQNVQCTARSSLFKNDNNIINDIFTSSREVNDRVGDEYSSSIFGQDVQLSKDLWDKRVVDIANQLLSVSDENNSDETNSSFENDLTGNDVTVEYMQLYTETSPENYNFAMNIMAYIELLNDDSWKVTVSHFDKNVKRLIWHIWNTLEGDFNSMIVLQGMNSEMVIKLMVDFTQWSINQEFDLGQFLNYCVLICQIGVVARKNNFKDAPLHAIHQIRNRIKLLKFEDFVQFMFDIVVTEYAKKFGQSRV